MKLLLRILRFFIPKASARTGWEYSDSARLPKGVGWDFRE
jgi:hypothetical protein